ncbi:hypothetical protein ABZW32_14480 [Streptomyces sp. NPDC004667]|uniref:hypothetical protein n=1 Tax=Streptomyces sp. NPDC004667 TaxID=3154285 RepID=UPI0033A175CF
MPGAYPEPAAITQLKDYFGAMVHKPPVRVAVRRGTARTGAARQGAVRAGSGGGPVSGCDPDTPETRHGMISKRGARIRARHSLGSAAAVAGQRHRADRHRRPDPTQRDRLVEIRETLLARIAEAEREGWRGEVEGLQVSLAGAEDKLAQLDAEPARHTAAVDLGMPTFTQIAARTIDSQPVRCAMRPRQ